MKINKSVLLVGPGQMGTEYAKILKNMQIPIDVVGIDDDTSYRFEKTSSLAVYKRGIKNWLKETKDYPHYAIVAVINHELGNVARSLIRSGIKNILLEKPGGLNFEDIKSVAIEAKKFNANVLIGYNRRYYASTLKAKEIIKQDQGVKSFTFEFTEWSHIIEDYPVKIEVKNNWLLHNSSHVIDLAFYLGGEPEKINSYSSGALSWHPKSSAFVGAGITKNGSLFSYHSNWDAPGRWGLEVLTQKHRLIFRPLEQLKIQEKASVAVVDVEIDDKLDIEFKPGLYRQVDAFLSNMWTEFKNIHQQISHLPIYDIITIGGTI